MNNKYRTVRRIALFALNDCETAILSVLMGYFAYFNQNIVGLSAVVLGVIATTFRIFDGITDPIVGVLMDRTRSKHGRFRPFMVVGSFLIILSIIAIFSVPNGLGSIQKYIYQCVFYSIYVIGYTLQSVVTRAAQSILTDGEKDRPLFLAFNGAYTSIACVIVPLIITAFLSKAYTSAEYSVGLLNPQLWKTASYIFSGLVVVCCIGAVIGIRDVDRPEFYAQKAKESVNKPRLRHYLHLLKHNRALQMIIISEATDKLGIMTCNVSVVYLFSNILLHSELQGQLAPIMLLSITGFDVLFTWYSRKKGLKTGYVTITWINIAFIILMLVVKPDPQNPLIYGIMYYIIFGAKSCASSIVFPMIADISDYEEYLTGQYVPSLVGTVISGIDKFTSAFANLGVGIAISAAGYSNVTIVPNAPVSAQFHSYLFICLCWVPLICELITAVAMRFYPLTTEKMAEIHETLKQRRATDAENSGT